MIDSRRIEEQLLAVLIKYPNAYADIAGLIDESDFNVSNDSYVHRTIFKLIKRIQSSGESSDIDSIVLIERLRASNIAFLDNIDIGEYIKSLLNRKVSEKAVLSIAKELKSYSVRRNITASCEKIIKDMKSDSSGSVPDIISKADQSYNHSMSCYSQDGLSPEDIYEDIEEVLEDLAENPRDPGMMTPHMPYMNRMYGSLLRPGNVTVVCARTGVGKTTFCLDFVTKISHVHNDVPVLHFDNGEMSKLELQMRQASALSGVPMYLIESGKWKSSSYIDPLNGQEVSEEQTRSKVYKAIKDMKGRSFQYYNVGGLSSKEMIQIATRHYYARVGRGNPMIFSFDYIKSTNNTDKNSQSWETVGKLVDELKKFVHRDITFNNRPMISMITSVQSNRTGITGNRNPDSIIDDESIVSLSDQITQFSSHLFILRPRLPREMQTEPDCYSRATHRLKCVKNRHLGEDRLRATEPVLMPAIDDAGDTVGNDRAEQNQIFLRIDNFGVEEVGDLRDMSEQMRTGNIMPDEDGDFSL